MNFKTIAISATLTAAAAITPLLGSAAHASSYDRGFLQVNHSDVSIMRVYVASSEYGDWSQMTLSRGPITPGTSRSISLYSDFDPGECLFDVEVDLSDGSSTVTQDVNFCRNGAQLTFTN